MMRFSSKTNVIPATLLFAAAMLPMSPLMTLGAYGDTETSTANVLQAGVWGATTTAPTAFFSLMLDEPGEAVIDSGDVAGTSTEQEVPEEPAPVVEIGEPVVEITTPEVVEDSEEPTETPTEEEPVVEEEVAPEPQPEEEPAPESDPQPEPTPNEEPTS